MVARTSHIALTVLDLDASVDYAKSVLGLHESERVDGVAYLSSNERHHELMLIAGDEVRLDRIAFEAHSVDELHEIRGRMALLQADPVTPTFSEAGVGQSESFIGPGGVVFEIFVDMLSVQRDDELAGVRRPNRLEHVTLTVTELEPMERFLIEGLGFIQSDRAPGALSWLRCSDQHHDFNLMVGARTALHHQAWEVDGLEEIGRLADLLASRHERLLWGPGRHGPGHVLFGYFRDINGAVNEYCSDVAHIDRDGYRVREWPNEPSTPNQWGPQSPPDFFDITIPPTQSGFASV